MTKQHWLHKYGNKQHEWKHLDNTSDRVAFSRQLGLVETSFDIDGVHYGGRADMTHWFEFEIRTSLDVKSEEFRDRIALAWTVLRLHHVLLLARSEDRMVDGQLQKHFVVDVPKNGSTAIREAGDTIIHIEGDEAIEQHDFRHHALNTARIVQPEKALANLFVLPITHIRGDRYRLPMMIVLAHMISDGLSLFHWLGHFVDLMNKPSPILYHDLVTSIDYEVLKSRLPPAQEDLYPPVSGSKARQRWFWAIIRILRHVKKPLPAGFVNPLRLKERITIPYSPKYSPPLDYSPDKLPPMNSGSSQPTMSVAASARLASVCRSAGTSVGAGVFALVAVVMMELHERQHPNIPLAERQPFVASFPLNPRPFFNYRGPHDSCMLAFSDGIAMPFLPTSLPLEGRLRLLAKVAHRQLKQFQKRKVAATDSHSPARMIATNYVSAVERAEEKLPEQYKSDVNPQGIYTPIWAPGSATCGVSSVGLVKDCAPGKYDLDMPLAREQDLAADFRDLKGGVRARDNEFLCGNSADNRGRLSYSVSYDASAMDGKLVKEWENRMLTILEREAESKL